MSLVRRGGAFVSTKTYQNVPCMYRRWQAEFTADRRVKAYNLTVKIVLEAHHLDDSKRVLSYHHDCLIEFDRMLDTYYRDKLILAKDDPEIAIFKALEMKSLASLSILPEIGAEHFASEMFSWMKVWLFNSDLIKRVDVKAVEVAEDGRSSSLYAE